MKSSETTIFGIASAGRPFSACVEARVFLHVRWKWSISHALADYLEHEGQLRVLEGMVKSLELHTEQCRCPVVTLSWWDEVRTLFFFGYHIALMCDKEIEQVCAGVVPSWKGSKNDFEIISFRSVVSCKHLVIGVNRSHT